MKNRSNLSKTKKIFFAAAQIGVLYDFANNRQQLLIGHVNYFKKEYLEKYLFLYLEK